MKFFFLLLRIILIFQFIKFIAKVIYKVLAIISILFVLILLPREVFEFSNFNKNFLYNFNPVTDLYGSDAMNSSLRHGSGN